MNHVFFRSEHVLLCNDDGSNLWNTALEINVLKCKLSDMPKAPPFDHWGTLKNQFWNIFFNHFKITGFHLFPFLWGFLATTRSIFKKFQTGVLGVSQWSKAEHLACLTHESNNLHFLLLYIVAGFQKWPITIARHALIWQFS